VDPELDASKAGADGTDRLVYQRCHALLKPFGRERGRHANEKRVTIDGDARCPAEPGVKAGPGDLELKTAQRRIPDASWRGIYDHVILREVFSDL